MTQQQRSASGSASTDLYWKEDIFLYPSRFFWLARSFLNSQTDTERGRDRERRRERHTEAETKRDKQRETETGRQKEKDRERQTQREAGTESSPRANPLGLKM